MKDELLSGKSSQILGSHDPIEIFVAVFGVASKTSQDKIAQVAIETMLMLTELCQKVYPKVNVKGNYEFGKYLDKVLAGCMDKIGDNNARLREKTEEACLAMAGQLSIGPQQIF